MENNELRTGNLVSTERGVVKIERFAYDEFRGFINDIGHSKRMFGFLIKEAETIPLTEEWLIKLGFDLIQNKNEYHNRMINEGAYHLKPVGDVHDHWYFYHKSKMITTHIRFVHQLQNLYHAFNGEELEIKEG